MWAMMPMFLVLLRGDCLGIFRSTFYVLRSTFVVLRSGSWFAVRRSARRTSPDEPRTTGFLPPVMCERLVRLGHPVGVFALLHRAATQVRGVEEFVRKLLVHRLAIAARARVADQPADAERKAAVRIHFHRHLVVRAADTARFHLKARLDVVDRLLEHLQRIVAALLLDDVEGLVNDALGGAALAVAHHAVDELAHERTLIDQVRRNVSLRNLSSSRHITESRYFGLRMSDCGISDSSIRNSEIRYPRSHMSRLLRSLRAVLRSSLHPSLHADGV